MVRTNKCTKLSFKRELFCQKVTTNLEIASAYLCAYPKTQSRITASKNGSRLMKNEEVIARIAELTKRSSAKAQVSQELVLKNLLDISNRCLQVAAVMIKDGKKTVQAEDKFICSKCGDVHTVGLFKFDAAGANKANELLGRYMAMFTDKVEHSGGLTFEDYILERKRRKTAAKKAGKDL